MILDFLDRLFELEKLKLLLKFFISLGKNEYTIFLSGLTKTNKPNISQSKGLGVPLEFQGLHHHRVNSDSILCWNQEKEKNNVCHVTPPDRGALSGTGKSYMCHR